MCFLFSSSSVLFCDDDNESVYLDKRDNDNFSISEVKVFKIIHRSSETFGLVT